MRLPLLLCVTSLVATTALAQESGSSSPSSSSPSGKSDKSSQSTQSDQSSQSSSSILSATGRGSGTAGMQQHLRGSKLMGAQVKTTSGEEVGRIEDVVLNPTSGKVDFAVITAEGKLCPVPWQLLSLSQGGSSSQGSTSSSSSTTSGSSSSSTSPSSPSSASSSSPSSSGIYASASMGQQPTFTLNVEKSKLQQGPSFERSRWPEMSSSWSQRVYSHYGVQAESGVGGTGSSSSSQSSPSSSSSDQGSSGSSSDSSSGKGSSDSGSSKSKSSSDSKK